MDEQQQVQVTFRDGATWTAPLEPWLSRYARLVGERDADEIGATDSQTRAYCVEEVAEGVRSGTEADAFERDSFLDWLACTVSWRDLRARQVGLRHPESAASHYAREWPTADLAIVPSDEREHPQEQERRRAS